MIITQAGYKLIFIATTGSLSCSSQSDPLELNNLAMRIRNVSRMCSPALAVHRHR